MKKNSDAKNISYTNYEIISIFIMMASCSFIGYAPRRMIKECGSAILIGALFICIVFYIIYSFIIKKVFNNEYDFFEIIKKTYPPLVQKTIGIVIYLFAMLCSYILISNILYNLKAVVYKDSSIFQIAVFFLVALYIICKYGFNLIFRISGYTAYVVIIYAIFLFVLSIPLIDFSNFLPILGTGPKVFTTNLVNMGIFTTMFFFLFFGGTVVNGKKRNNKRNFNRIMIFTSLAGMLLMTMLTGLIPVELLDTRYTLLLDISSILSFSTTSIKNTPLMIFIFSFIIFLSSSFLLLTGLMSAERLNVVKNYSKYITPSVIIMVILFLIPTSLMEYDTLLQVFYGITNIITIGLPVITLFIYSIKTHGGAKRFNNKKDLPPVTDEVN